MEKPNEPVDPTTPDGSKNAIPPHSKPRFIEASNLPEGEKVYLRKGFGGYRVVTPAKDPETGKINWFNALLGGKAGLFQTACYIVIALMLFAGIKELIGNYKLVADNPCKFCRTCDVSFANKVATAGLNFTLFTNASSSNVTNGSENG